MPYTQEMYLNDESVRNYDGQWIILWVSKKGNFYGAKKYSCELLARASAISTFKAVKGEEYAYNKPGTNEQINPADILCAIPMPYVGGQEYDSVQ